MTPFKYIFYIVLVASIGYGSYQFIELKKRYDIQENVIDTLNQSLVTLSEINEDEKEKQKFDLQNEFNKEKIEMRLKYDKSKTNNINSNRIYL